MLKRSEQVSPAGRGRFAVVSGVFTALTLAVGLLSAGVSVAADVYKWVDENGVTHYSARPPETDRNYEEVRVRSRNRGYETTTPRTTPQRSADNEEAEDDNSLTKPGNEISVKNPDKVAANCERARNNIATIESRRRVLLDDGQGGKRRLSDEEREALMKESQDYIDRWCRN